MLCGHFVDPSLQITCHQDNTGFLCQLLQEDSCMTVGNVWTVAMLWTPKEYGPRSG